MSASPRRNELLARTDIPFDVAPAEAHETWVGVTAEGVAMENAERKARASSHFGNPDRLLLGADTLIHFDGKIMGKPAGATSAKRMLELLSGSTHEVITGFCLLSFSRSGSIRSRHVEAVTSVVSFRELTKKDLRRYLESDEWRGKAGAYAIQGEAGKFITKISGDFDNVVGLPTTIIRERIGTVFSDYQLL